MVPRRILFKILRKMGCGSVMLCALVAIYQLTESMIGTAVVTITLDVLVVGVVVVVVVVTVVVVVVVVIVIVVFVELTRCFHLSGLKLSHDFT